MAKGHSNEKVLADAKPEPRPKLIALAVAVFGMLGMLVVDHGPWNHSAMSKPPRSPTTRRRAPLREQPEPT